MSDPLTKRLDETRRLMEESREKLITISKDFEASRERRLAASPMATMETLYLPMEAGVEAVVTIQIKSAQPGIDRPQRRAPTVSELKTVAELLTRRVYQFTPDPTIEA